MGATIIYPNEIYSTCAFLAFILAIIPLPWHLQAWNTGTCIFMVWAALGALNAFINSILWHHTVINFAPVWCDISTRIIILCNFGLPAAMLCINRRLYHIASIKTVTISTAEKRRGVLIDLAIGCGLPIIFTVLSIISQGNRFNILEDIGCYTSILTTPVSLVLTFAGPMYISLVSAIYAVFGVRAFWKTRLQFNSILANHSSMNKGRYLRLMALGCFEVCVTLPLATYILVINAQGTVYPYHSWEWVHTDFYVVQQFPHVLWAVNGTPVEITRWLFVVCPVVFFMFFGFAEEARKNYRSAYQTISKHTGISSIGTWGNSGTFGSSKGSTTEVNSSGGTLPVWVKRDIERKRDTLDSISDMTASIDDGASFDEKIHGEKGVPDYEHIVLPVAGGSLEDIKTDIPPSPSSSNSSSAHLPVPQVHTRPDSGVIEISSIQEDAPIRVSDRESRV